MYYISKDFITLKNCCLSPSECHLYELKNIFSAANSHSSFRGATFILDELVPFEMIPYDQRPIHAGQGGPLFAGLQLIVSPPLFPQVWKKTGSVQELVSLIVCTRVMTSGMM